MNKQKLQDRLKDLESQAPMMEKNKPYLRDIYNDWKAEINNIKLQLIKN